MGYGGGAVKLELWQVHDDPTHCFPDERTWSLVWAETEHDAKLLAASVYDGEVREMQRAGIDAHFLAERICERNVGIFAVDVYMPMRPGVERRYEVMRLAGWAEEDERRCDSCGLAAMGIEKYAVCAECYQCAECGCECEEENLTNEEIDAALADAKIDMAPAYERLRKIVDEAKRKQSP
jgi:hypothetical protein